MHYGQFCPVAKAAELLGERWMLLIIRELLFGSTRYADLQRGLGKISPSVLSQRLKMLADAGVIEKKKQGATTEYILTECGKELEPLITSAGTWGQRWVRSRMSKDELDVDLLMIDLQRNIDVHALGKGAVLLVEFTDLGVRSRRWWLVESDGRLDLCTEPPGQPATITLSSKLKTLTQIWMGDLDVKAALKQGILELKAPRHLLKSPQSWLKLSQLSGVKPAA